MQLKGKTVLITGATRGIGKATKELLESKGCKVIGFGRKKCNLVISDNIEKLVKKLKPIDIFINNAGYFFTSSVRSFPTYEWNYSFIINIFAPFFLTQHLLRKNKFKKEAIILNINSWDIVKHPVQQIAYNCSKAALQELTTSLAKELFMERIFVTQIMLPTTRTDMLKRVNPANPLPKKILTPRQAAMLIYKKLKEFK